MACTRHIGIDYSGAITPNPTPNASLNGLRVYLAQGDTPEVQKLLWRGGSSTLKS